MKLLIIIFLAMSSIENLENRKERYSTSELAAENPAWASEKQVFLERLLKQFSDESKKLHDAQRQLKYDGFRVSKTFDSVQEHREREISWELFKCRFPGEDADAFFLEKEAELNRIYLFNNCSDNGAISDEIEQVFNDRIEQYKLEGIRIVSTPKFIDKNNVYQRFNYIEEAIWLSSGDALILYQSYNLLDPEEERIAFDGYMVLSGDKLKQLYEKIDLE